MVTGSMEEWQMAAKICGSVDTWLHHGHMAAWKHGYMDMGQRVKLVAQSGCMHVTRRVLTRYTLLFAAHIRRSCLPYGTLFSATRWHAAFVSGCVRYLFNFIRLLLPHDFCKVQMLTMASYDKNGSTNQI